MDLICLYEALYFLASMEYDKCESSAFYRTESHSEQIDEVLGNLVLDYWRRYAVGVFLDMVGCL